MIIWYTGSIIYAHIVVLPVMEVLNKLICLAFTLYYKYVIRYFHAVICTRQIAITAWKVLICTIHNSLFADELLMR